MCTQVWDRAGYKLAAGENDAKKMEAAGIKGVKIIAHNPANNDRLTSDLCKSVRADEIQLVMVSTRLLCVCVCVRMPCVHARRWGSGHVQTRAGGPDPA